MKSFSNKGASAAPQNISDPFAPADEKELLKKKTPLWLCLLFSFSGGVLFACALPPFNLYLAAFAALAPLVWCSARLDWKRSALCGWIWGLGWALFAFQFLREIELPVPYLLAPVLAIWPAVSGAIISAGGKNLLMPGAVQAEEYETRKNYFSERLPWYRTLLFILWAAVVYTLIEWTRSRLFTWNDLSVTQWRNLPFIQLCSVTGSYGVLFLTALGGAALGAITLRKGKYCALGIFILLFLNWGWGAYRMKNFPYVSDGVWTPALIQGNLSQRRHPGEKEFREALQTYISLSSLAAKEKPDVIIWPESAVPMPLRSSHPWGQEYARELGLLLLNCKVPMLIGTLDFAYPKPGEVEYGSTNSALYLDAEGRLRYKYDKIHRVPFGEYIPFRKYLPEFLIRIADMGRDLTSGVNRTPLELPGQLKVSIAVCYEGVFGYLTRDFARRGAKVLTVLSNDAWYPRSSEPEQHLANAVMRAVETGLPMVRCGNNGGSGIVLPDGTLTGFLDVPNQKGRVEIKRGQAWGKVKVPYKNDPVMTFYVKYGEWFIALLLLAAGVLLFVSFYERIVYCKKIPRSNRFIDWGR